MDFALVMRGAAPPGATPDGSCEPTARMRATLAAA